MGKEIVGERRHESNLAAQESQANTVWLSQGIAQHKWALLNRACVFNQLSLLTPRTLFNETPTSSHSQTHTDAETSPTTQSAPG